MTTPTDCSSPPAAGPSAEEPERTHELATAAKATAKPCRGRKCTTRVIWARNGPGGSPIPLDASAPVYRLEQHGPDLVAVRDLGAFVLHHKTCRDVGSFSGSSPASTTQPPHKAAGEASASRRH